MCPFNGGHKTNSISLGEVLETQPTTYSLEFRFSADELTKLQEAEETLNKIQEAIMNWINLLEMEPPGRGSECEKEQL